MKCWARLTSGGGNRCTSPCGELAGSEDQWRFIHHADSLAPAFPEMNLIMPSIPLLSARDWMLVSPSNSKAEAQSSVWQYWEVRSLGDDYILRVEPSCMGFMLLDEETWKKCSLSALWGHWEDSCLQARRALPRTCSWCHLDLGFPSLLTCEK